MRQLRVNEEGDVDANTATPSLVFHVPYMHQPKSSLNSPIHALFSTHYTKMAKFSILLSLLVALLFVALAHASKPQLHSCDQQLDQVNLDPCEKLLLKKISVPEDEDEEEENSRIRRRINHLRKHFHLRKGNSKQQDQDQYQDQDQDEQEAKQILDKCCRQLVQLRYNPSCHCQALQNILDNSKEKLQSKAKLELMEKEIFVLPATCGWEFPIGCDLRPDELKEESRHGAM
ncbi:hypothetical protein RJT34_29046 [Clitoria ternatea]|uniref:Bifunctional inhibitor/plant lipid transfer protein/seed storage helical domain-containing protein n=1 Tax=Clitoria ternatea TaxID=43366 RepID=A0AAN9FA51_CLITE